MLGDLLVLVGVGLFIKVFFISSENIHQNKEADAKQSKKRIILHIVLGLAFVLLGRWYLKL